MRTMLFEIEGIGIIVKILSAIMEEENKDSPQFKRSQELLNNCNEILENYIGIENDFSNPTVKSMYYDFILNLLDELIGKNVFVNIGTKKIKSVQLCVDNDDLILLHIGDSSNEC